MPEQFFGKYRGVVVSVLDPERRGRIQAQVPAVYKEDISVWALPCLPMVGLKSGLLALPQIGSMVWIEFEQGNPELPIWTGGFWESGMAPSVLVPLQTLLQTAGGNSILIDDTPGKGGITLKTLTGDSLKLSPTGVTLKTAVGDKVELTPTGIVLATVAGAKLAISPATGIELTTGQGASIKLMGPTVNINSGALEVT